MHLFLLVHWRFIGGKWLGFFAVHWAMLYSKYDPPILYCLPRDEILRMCMPYASFSTSPWSRCLSRLDACPQGRKAHEGWHAGGCSCFPSGIDSRCSWRVPFVAVTSCLESNNCHENTRHPDTSSCAFSSAIFLVWYTDSDCR